MPGIEVVVDGVRAIGKGMLLVKDGLEAAFQERLPDLGGQAV